MNLFNEFQRADVRGSNFRLRRFLFFGLWSAFFGLTLLGCESTNSKNSSSCWLFPKKNSEVESLPTRKEDEVINRAALAETGPMKGTWEPTESEILEARNAGIDVKKFVWAAQRPNGGVLFPKTLPAPGPIVVLEPSKIAAPIGSEIVLVASFVGEDSTYLRVGEKIEWSLTGVGTFLASNPRNTLCCDWTTTKKINDRYLTTETTNKLWRIHRGTETTLDDATILRGQTWATVSAQEEGTSSVVVFANNIDNWDRRKASAEIYWIDAAFVFPESNVAPPTAPQELTTFVYRRSNAEPRPGWTVRYEVLSGDAGLGPKLERVFEATTDADGKATAVARLQPGTNADTCKISATVLRPASATEKAVAVDQRTFYLTWTESSAIMLKWDKSQGGELAIGENLTTRLLVSNYSDFPQDVVVKILVPQNAEFVASKDPMLDFEKSWATCEILNLAPNHSTTIDFVLRKTGAGAINPNFRIVSTKPTDLQEYKERKEELEAQQALNANPPVESPTQNAPTQPFGTTPPPESPTPNAQPQPNDPASEIPEIPNSSANVEIGGPNVAAFANAGARTFETTAFRFPERSTARPNVATTAEPFETRFALTNPARSSENVVVKIVANPGVELFVDAENRRSEIVYPARPLDEIADVVFQTRAVATESGARSLLFFAYRENGELLAGDVYPITVADRPTAAASSETRIVARPETPPSEPSDENGKIGENRQNDKTSETASNLTPESATVFPKGIFAKTPAGAVEKARAAARVGEPFLYRAVVRNFADFPLEPDALRVELETPDALLFSAKSAQPETTTATPANDADFENAGKNVRSENAEKRNATFRLAKRLEPSGERSLDVELTPLKSGKTEILFRLFDAKTGALLNVAKHPIEIVESDADVEKSSEK